MLTFFVIVVLIFTETFEVLDISPREAWIDFVLKQRQSQTNREAATIQKASCASPLCCAIAVNLVKKACSMCKSSELYFSYMTCATTSQLQKYCRPIRILCLAHCHFISTNTTNFYLFNIYAKYKCTTCAFSLFIAHERSFSLGTEKRTESDDDEACRLDVAEQSRCSVH